MRISDWSSDVCSSDLAQFIAWRTAPGRKHHAIGVQYAAIAQCRVEAAVGALIDALNVGIELQVDAVPAQLVAQMGAHTCVETAQEQPAAIQLRDLHAEAAKEIGRASCRERVCQHG